MWGADDSMWRHTHASVSLGQQLYIYIYNNYIYNVYIYYNRVKGALQLLSKRHK